MLAFQHIENKQQSKEKQLKKGLTVVELFTSQGCSSCPPADKLLSTIKSNPNVIALSYHVDYWNKLGWKDSYSDASYSSYQRSYAQQLHSGVYTPQMVVNGSTEFIGSRKASLNINLTKKSNVQLLNAPVVERTENSISYSYDLDGQDGFENAYALLVLDEHITEVSSGENANSKLKNVNIVLERVVLDKNTATGKSQFALPQTIDENAKYRVAILLQNKNLEVTAAGISTLG
jgi:hypothetical protein